MIDANPGGVAPSLPTFSGKGLQAGVDLDDSADLLDLMQKAMRLADVKVLVYAFRTDAPAHAA